MIEATRTALYTVMIATPYLGTAVALIVATADAGRARWIARSTGGAFMGALVGTGWEFTVNRDHPASIKTEVITGTSAIGAGAGFLGPYIFGRGPD